jgi:3-phosphoshikimate 1-carboxyvinyltransferase
MQVKLSRSKCRGTISVPSSKSYTIRGLMCAAMARGASDLLSPLASDDTAAAVRVLQQIGVEINLEKDKWTVTGGNFKASRADLFCGDSAATLRFMSAISALVPGRSRLTAGPSLAKRPVKTLVDALRKWGVDISCRGETAPVIVSGNGFKGGITELPGNISSQFVSALLLIAPMADKDAFVWLTTPLESESYVAMTLECLNKFGIAVKASDEMMEFEVIPQSYRPAVYKVEGDWSSASYLLALGALCGETRVKNLNAMSLQGDKEMVKILRQFGAEVNVSLDEVTVKEKNRKTLKANLNECIDLLPTVAVMAALAEGESQLSGIKRARLKESDRVQVLKEELYKCGVSVKLEEDKMIVQGGTLKSAQMDAHGDHRMAMAFSLLGAASGNITIQGAECVSKTFPEFWPALRGLGVQYDEQ